MAKKKGSYHTGKERLAAQEFQAEVKADSVICGAHITRTADGQPHITVHTGSDAFMLAGLLSWSQAEIQGTLSRMISNPSGKEVKPLEAKTADATAIPEPNSTGSAL